MVNMGRRVADCVKLVQEEALAIIPPLEQTSCLKKCKHRSQK